MSRTIRIKNNWRSNRSSFSPRGIPPGVDWEYKWMDGEEIGEDPDYRYLIRVPDFSKEGLWSYKKYMHADGKAHSYYGGIPAGWVYRSFNRAERRDAKVRLQVLPLGEDVDFNERKRSVPYAYY